MTYKYNDEYSREANIIIREIETNIKHALNNNVIIKEHPASEGGGNKTAYEFKLLYDIGADAVESTTNKETLNEVLKYIGLSDHLNYIMENDGKKGKTTIKPNDNININLI